MKQRGSSAEPTQRQLRVGEQIRHIIADTMQRGHFNDPVLIDLNLVSISEVRVSPDLKHATAYVMSLGGHNMDKILPALNRDKNVFKKEVARQGRLRFTPTIRFVTDHSFDEAEKIENILRDINSEKRLEMARKRKGDKIDGWINLDKPSGMTSTQAMAKVRWLLKAQKAGHAGTLDPLATGILPIALGEATKTISYIQDDLKTYSFTVKWGEQRDTDDLEGKAVATSDKRPSEDQIKTLLAKYTGDIQQTPPQFSAIKVDGQRAYDLARGGEEFELQSREVHIEKLELLAARPDEADFRMVCGKGTYVRSLARDMGLDLGCLGHITLLKREKVGPFTLETAISLDKLGQLSDSPALNEAVLLPLETALDDIPALAVREDEAARLRNGQVLAFVSRPDFERLERAGLDGRLQNALVMCNSKPVALVEAEGPQIRPVRILNI